MSLYSNIRRLLLQPLDSVGKPYPNSIDCSNSGITLQITTSFDFREHIVYVCGRVLVGIRFGNRAELGLNGLGMDFQRVAYRLPRQLCYRHPPSAGQKLELPVLFFTYRNLHSFAHADSLPLPEQRQHLLTE